MGQFEKRDQKKYVDEKVESFKTGGGPKKVIRFTPLDYKIKSIIGVAVTGDSNPFDSDTSMRDYTGPQDIADCQNDKNMAGVEELKEGSSSIFHATNWASWNPAALKTPKAYELSKQEPINKDEQLPLGPTWTPKRLLFGNKIVLNDHTE
ncbi:hypothetical protein JTB14_000043 [Gonioctena quinquepunctata]|nr:hypothetical protein JTB14_000043 [Gonioctena quinquepunctata]